VLKSHLPTISLQRSAGYVPVLPDSVQAAAAAAAARAAGLQWIKLRGQRSQVPDDAVLQVCEVRAAPSDWLKNQPTSPTE